MRLADFDFELPPTAIAQHPTAQRDASRLLRIDRRSGRREHRHFAELDQLLDPGDLIVFNDTQVQPTRLTARKHSGGRVEVLFVEACDERDADVRWHVLVQGAGRLRPGSSLVFDGGLEGVLVDRRSHGWTLELEATPDKLQELFVTHGRMPLPPYIKRSGESAEGAETRDQDRERYQTVYAKHPGAVAAPTAGLHFTQKLLERLARRQVHTAFITLHVGLGTFLPVRVDTVVEHVMHAERFALGASAARAIADARARGGRVIAVGTTVVRVLEHCARTIETGASLEASTGSTDLYIYPGFEFRVVDAMITNFHLPRSTLLMLVCAFGGRELMLDAYREAIEHGYRFYSYGDAMLVG